MSLGTAFALKSAVDDALMQESVMIQAAMLTFNRHEMNDDDFITMLESMTRSAVANGVGFATQILMTESELDAMVNEIEEVEGMGL